MRQGDPGDDLYIIVSEEVLMLATGDVRTLCIDQQPFEGILRERPQTSLAVMRMLCARQREVQDWLQAHAVTS